MPTGAHFTDTPAAGIVHVDLEFSRPSRHPLDGIPRWVMLSMIWFQTKS